MIVLGATMLALSSQIAKASGLQGDVNGDGKVDNKDLGIISKAFGSCGPGYMYAGSPAHPRWNQAADLNGDNKVNIRDLAIVALNYGKTTS